MDFVGDDRHPFVFSLFSPLSSFYYTSPPLSLSPLFLFLISTLFNSLSAHYASLPHCLKKVQKDASAAVRKACSSSSRSSGDGGGGGGGIRQELMLKSLSSKLKQKSKETRGIEERYYGKVYKTSIRGGGVSLPSRRSRSSRGRDIFFFFSQVKLEIYHHLFFLFKSSSKKKSPRLFLSFPSFRTCAYPYTYTHNQPLRSLPAPYIDAGLDELLDGGGTVGTFESAIRYCRSEVLDLLAEALKALVMSSTEKLSLRGMVDREVGSGIMSVIVVDDVVTMMERRMMRGGWL